MINIADLRREYTRGGLRRQQLTHNPLDLFEQWLKQAHTAGISDPTAVSVATVDQQGQPHQRLMLLKQYDERGFVFYTNLGSRKAEQIKHDPLISLLFPWYALDRQISITGRAESLSTPEVLKYFHSRPRESQLAAWASPQSSPLASRAVLEHTFFAFQQKFSQDAIIPLPRFWGGFRVYATSIEFWQGGAHRLHDRFLYQRQQHGWAITRLAP